MLHSSVSAATKVSGESRRPFWEEAVDATLYQVHLDRSTPSACQDAMVQN